MLLRIRSVCAIPISGIIMRSLFSEWEADIRSPEGTETTLERLCTAIAIFVH